MVCTAPAFSESCVGGILVALQYFMEPVMKDIFATIRKTLETAGWRALDVTKRETVRAREDLRKIHAKTWSDRGHL